MNGHIIHGTNICVDYWLRTPPKKYIHFLTHLHSDHTYGLKSTFRETIYTSPFNGWLIKRWFQIDPSLVVTFAVGDNHIVYDETSKEYFSVTLIDANHCPGSVMFLFQGSFGNILYTGDFRYNQNMLEEPMLKSLVENEVLQQLYLDNTFAAEHCEFPPRHKVLGDIIRLIKDHPEHFVLIGVRKLGKEEVLEEIAMALQEKVCVPAERYQILSFLQFRNVFTTNTEESRVHVREMHRINSTYITKLQEEKGPVLTVILSALHSVTLAGEKGKTKLEQTVGVHYMPYSDHSPHSELREFVYKVKPHSIYPIVNQTRPATLGKQESSRGGLFIQSTEIYKNSVIPQSILKYCKNPLSADDNAAVTTDPNQSGFYNSKENLKVLNSINQKDYERRHKQFAALSEYTEDESEVNSQEVRHVRSVLKDKIQVNSLSQFTEDKSETISKKQENVRVKESLVTRQKQGETPNPNLRLTEDKSEIFPQDKMLSATKKTLSSSVEVSSKKNTKKNPKKKQVEKKSNHLRTFEKSATNTIEFDAPNEKSTTTIVGRESVLSEDEYYTMSDEDLDPSQDTSAASPLSEESARKRRVIAAEGNPNKKRRINSEEMQDSSSNTTGQTSRPTKNKTTVAIPTPNSAEYLTGFKKIQKPMPSEVYRLKHVDLQSNTELCMFSPATSELKKCSKVKSKYFHTTGEVSKEKECNRHDTVSVCLCDVSTLPDLDQDVTSTTSEKQLVTVTRIIENRKPFTSHTSTEESEFETMSVSEAFEGSQRTVRMKFKCLKPSNESVQSLMADIASWKRNFVIDPVTDEYRVISPSERLFLNNNNKPCDVRIPSKTSLLNNNNKPCDVRIPSKTSLLNNNNKPCDVRIPSKTSLLNDNNKPCDVRIPSKTSLLNDNNKPCDVRIPSKTSLLNDNNKPCDVRSPSKTFLLYDNNKPCDVRSPSKTLFLTDNNKPRQKIRSTVPRDPGQKCMVRGSQVERFTLVHNIFKG